MLRKTLLTLFASMLLAAQPAQAEGELLVMPARIKVFNGHDYGVSVRNMGDGPLYLSATLQKVMNPGLAPEEHVPLSQLEHPGLLASPDKLTLGPGQSRTISLKSLSVPAAEEMYRLYVVPVRAMQVEEAPQDKISAPMSVSIGYGVLVQHMPPPGQQRSAWSYRCEGEGVRLENTGNVSLVLADIASPDRRQEQNRVVLFPGLSRRFEGRELKMLVGDAPQGFDCRG
ncbi:pilus assembly protein [Achromobacter pestifer]|uniref:Pilus assembly protein n=1 Tax=Achromobacter pestifer TaxID=1353889 RepID=A0A7D4DVY6_9BURK|nr:pilus assembly protein [Achromobacter pestifer]QKH34745.1 pilus assembly protein [Achromobacter pestifer]